MVCDGKSLHSHWPNEQQQKRKARLTFGAFFALSSLTFSPWAVILSLRSELPLDGADVCGGTFPGFHSCPVAVL